MIYNSIEEELWRIFTFYALHSDPTMPEVLRPPNFIKFCKDCQIISKKLTPSVVELEMAKLARVKSQSVDYNVSNVINFLDFMQLLEVLALKVYPRDTGDVAAKRLILENVLLLSNRRTPTLHLYDIDNHEATKLITETFQHGLHEIFNYYTNKAHLRRCNIISIEKMKQKEIIRQHGLLETDKEGIAHVISNTRKQNLIHLKNIAINQRYYISYKEYLMFCQDFSLKSSALLTATQLGDIFLSLVPLQSASDIQDSQILNHNSATEEGLLIAGMNFSMFCKAIISMALIAYRSLEPTVPTAYKVKALLVFMLKCAVDGNKTLEMLKKDRSHTLSATKGSLHLYGSSEFVQQFQSHWQREGYCDYTQPPQTASLSGTHMLRKVVGEAPELEDAAAAGGGAGAGRSRTHSSVSVDSHAMSVALGTGNGSGGRYHTPTRPHMGGSNSNWALANNNIYSSTERAIYTLPTMTDTTTIVRPEFPVSLEGKDIQVLLQKRPELIEFLNLEIHAMKIETEKLVKNNE